MKVYSVRVPGDEIVDRVQPIVTALAAFPWAACMTAFNLESLNEETTMDLWLETYAKAWPITFDNKPKFSQMV